MKENITPKEAATQPVAEKDTTTSPKKKQCKKRTMSRTMEAALRLKGSLIVNDPAFLL